MTGPASGNLPAVFSSFVGRRRNIAEIRRRLETARLVTLTGVGGVGKTRLALEAAASMSKGFPDGVWLVDLAPVRDPSAVPGATATALGVPDLGPGPVGDRLADHLAGRRTLVVLDNCEHLADACARLAQSLLGAAPGLRVLATSRASLGLTGECVLTVAPLSVPDEAVELVRDRAAAVRPSFRITDANREAVTRLCERLDGLPLAIELAATRLRTLTVDQLVERLEDRFGLLTAGSSTARPHQRTLRALIDWSHELCSPAEQLLWRRLSVFAGGFDLAAAEDVCCGDGLPRGEILDHLDRLVAQSVVLTSEDESRPQYRMLETIREYGRGRLAESGEKRRLLRRHRDFFRALAESSAAAWYGPGQEDALARLRAQHANLRLALEYEGVEAGDTQAALALVAALRFHWCADGFLGEGRDRIERALTAAPEPTAARAGALWAGAWAALLQGDHRSADRWLTEADELGERLDDPVVRAYVQGLRGTSALFLGRLDEAVSLYEGAVSAQIAAGEGPGALFCLFQLSVARAHLGDPRAAESGRRAVAAAEEHGERWCRSYALWALGHDAWVRGDGPRALAFARAGLEIQRGFNDYVGTALMLELLAWITASDGDCARAGRLLGAIRALWRKIGTGITAFGPHLAEHHARCEETVVRALGTAGYERALAEGSGHDAPGPAIADALDPPVARAEPAAAADPLSRREREVAALVARGMSNRRIAAELVLSPRTVDGHVEHILAKLGFRSRTEIAAWVAAHTNQVPTP
ncbi:ATP-binding protein [Streptomyces ipomoeae]|uniref:ATP-binding protein n=1 Tax=Streptomyces ipomoeae TaxID=103232 RepID=UPI0011469624|nr:LuxR C-terminal-related transcriptional regulator [Streptomyces ipomoeae]TQE23584.1 LuxR family transcriptional regulator [Streptomyces ipomoeae]